MDSDDPAIAAMHLTYAGVQVAASAAHDAALAGHRSGEAQAVYEGAGGFYKRLRRGAPMLRRMGTYMHRMLPPTRSTPPEEPPDLQRAPPSWGVNVDEVRWWGEDLKRVIRRAPRLSAGHVDMWRWEHIKDLDVPSWRMWVNRCIAGRCHSRTAAFSANGTVSALQHKDDHAAREKRAKTGGPLRVRPPGVGSVLVRLASAHALVRVGADAREAMGPCTPGIAATKEKHNKLAADRASSAPAVQGVHWYYPFVVEDRGRLGKSALTVVYIFARCCASGKMSGVQAAVHIEEGKNQGRVGQTKVKRYWPGQAPAWAGEQGEEEEGLLALAERVPGRAAGEAGREVGGGDGGKDEEEEVRTTRVAAPVVVKKADDPRLRRLAERGVRAPEVVRRRRHASDEEEEEEVDVRRPRRRPAEDEDSDEQRAGGDGGHPITGAGSGQESEESEEEGDGEKEEDEEAIALRRQMLRARLQEKLKEQAAAAEETVQAGVGEESEESEEDSEYETDSEDEDAGRQMLKPVFVSKSDRETIKERERLEAESARQQERERMRLEERKAETRDIVIETIRKEHEAENAGPTKTEEARVEAWKLREAGSASSASADARTVGGRRGGGRSERQLKNMTEAENRAAWELATPKAPPGPGGPGFAPLSTPWLLGRMDPWWRLSSDVQPVKEKQKWNFMQKYWHKGAYFQEATDGKDQTGKGPRSSDPRARGYLRVQRLFDCLGVVR
eukprot:jgi/Tetstr1/454323/TSEL_041242.t1